MHSYYKKLVEERENRLGEKRIMGPVSKRYKINKTHIPDMQMPLASFYRKNKFDIKEANPEEKYHPSLNITFHDTRTDELSPEDDPAFNYSLNQTFMTSKENFAPKPPKMLDNSFLYNPPMTIKPKRRISRLPELSLMVLEKNYRQESPQNTRGVIVMKPLRTFDRSHLKDLNIVNPNSFKHTKVALADKYDRVPPKDIKKMTEKLAMNRVRKSTKYRVGGLRVPTNESIENIKDDPLLPMNENYSNFSPLGIERKIMEIRNSSNASRGQANGKFEMIPEKRKASFEEHELSHQIDQAFRAEEERLDKLGNWKKKKMTLGDKYELLHKINENYLISGMNQHRSLLQSLVQINR
jgi:hypothetical protein